MLPWLFLLPLPLPVLATLDKTFGAPPQLLSKYTPLDSGAWKCLDGSKTIPWEFVNDDSCDCPDGSDEPGTGACPNTTFYCQNIGHIGASIPSSRVRDGLCEPQCCDGSDEHPGVCENSCKEIGEKYRRELEALRKIQKKGAKIRSSYISFAQKEKIRLENVIRTTQEEIDVREKEVERLRDIADRTESLSAAALEHKKQSPLYFSLIQHSKALKSLQREHKKLQEREKALGSILDSLRSGYNPNYQDMAVLEAVRGWEELASLPHINDRDKDKDDSNAEETTDAPPPETTETEEDGLWSAEELEKDLDELLKTDYVSLLMEHDEHVRVPGEGSILFDLTNYMPDSWVPQYEEIKDFAVSWLEKIGIVNEEAGVNSEASKARQAFQDAESTLNRVKSESTAAEKELSELFKPEKYGKEGEWKKLQNTCIENNAGDYTYELCFFGEAKQKPNNGGQTFSLGKFSSWTPNLKPEDKDYYGTQIYNRGTRCWNGPERNVILLLECGVENALLSIAELEKCEYQFKATTPALCLPLDSTSGNGSNGKDEL